MREIWATVRVLRQQFDRLTSEFKNTDDPSEKQVLIEEARLVLAELFDLRRVFNELVASSKGLDGNDASTPPQFKAETLD